MDKVLIFDFGSQTTQLISRRIRELGVYTEIVPGTGRMQDMEFSSEVKGLIFSGSPHSVYSSDAPRVDEQIYRSGVPILGICYGTHRIVLDHGGKVNKRETSEFGRAKITIQDRENRLVRGIPPAFTSWMSHGDSILELPAGFTEIASSETFPAIIYSEEKQFYGLQFHPEVTHTEYGTAFLENFVCRICGAGMQWSMEAFMEEKKEELRKKIGDEKVLILVSGGVDSTVTAAILLTSIEPEQLHLMYIDTGLMRHGETEEVKATLKRLGAKNLYIIDAADDFLGALAGVEDPEEKRKIIGDLFITIQEREIKKTGIDDSFLAQGTLYTDLIESGKGVGTNAKVIKSHHNVRSPLVEEKRKNGLVVEPLDRLYKDEVREVGKAAGLPDSVVSRHPFPGPGLAVRILGEVTKEKCDILRDADRIYIEELRNRNLYDKIWQAFCVLLPVRSVGVTGDVRNYGWVVVLRAVVSRDGMTADVFPFPTEDLLEISARITNSVAKVGRVVYDISSKPPATIEWE